MKTKKVVAMVVDVIPERCGDCDLFHFRPYAEPYCGNGLPIDFGRGNPPDWCPLQELEVVCDESQ